MLGCIRPLAPRMWDVVDGICAGFDPRELSAHTGLPTSRVRAYVNEISNRVPGHRNHTARERILYWRAKQIGVAEFFAGLRDERGFPIVERDLPVEHPDSHAHDALFPEL